MASAVRRCSQMWGRCAPSSRMPVRLNTQSKCAWCMRQTEQCSRGRRQPRDD